MGFIQVGGGGFDNSCRLALTTTPGVEVVALVEVAPIMSRP